MAHDNPRVSTCKTGGVRNSPRVLASLSAYACEGGFDGPYQPATCFTPTISLGRHAGPGIADSLWEEYESVLSLASSAGLAGICLEISWARLEPRRGQRDEAALERYFRVMSRAQALGLHVAMAAIDAAWPAWLGLEAWLMPWVVPVAVEYVEWVASALPADSLSIFAQRERLLHGFINDSAGPPWRRGATHDAASASRNLDIIESASRAKGGSHFVSSVNVELDDLGEIDTYDVDEVHVRSLVSGAGPLRSSRGALGRRGERWVVVNDELAPALTRA